MGIIGYMLMFNRTFLKKNYAKIRAGLFM